MQASGVDTTTMVMVRAMTMTRLTMMTIPRWVLVRLLLLGVFLRLSLGVLAHDALVPLLPVHLADVLHREVLPLDDFRDFLMGAVSEVCVVRVVRVES
jgi:RsiW-degrading membrane proteinase PrsW (M82 family)